MINNDNKQQVVQTTEVIKQPDSNVSTKKKVLRVLLLVAFFILALWSVVQITSHFSQGDTASLKEVFSNVNTKFMVAGILFAVLLFFIDGLKYSLVNKMLSGRFDYLHCVNLGLMGKFYDNITPFNTGGQPYQVWMLYKRGYSGSVSTAIPIIKYVVQLLCVVLVSIVLYIVNHGALDALEPAQSSAIKVATYVGVSIAALMPTAVIFFSVMPKFCSNIIAFFCKLLAKMRIVKDADKAIAKALDFLHSYSETFISVSRKIVLLISLALLCVVEFLMLMAVPYLFLLALGGTTPSVGLLFDVITLNAYTLFASSLVPTPGNSGAIEFAYSMVFAPIEMGEGMLFWLVMLWRTATYYIYIVMGLVQTCFKFICRAIASRKSKRASQSSAEQK